MKPLHNNHKPQTHPATTDKQSGRDDMVLRSRGTGKRISYPGSASYSSVWIRWASRERTAYGVPVEVRDPVEKTTTYSIDKGFTAAGKHYGSPRQLYEHTDASATWCKDVYGREVLYLAERFPCFDSYDAIHEHRFYRWFFLREDNKLTRIFFADDNYTIYVTEDVAYLEQSCWEEMKDLGYLD